MQTILNDSIYYKVTPWQKFFKRLTVSITDRILVEPKL